VTTALPSPDLPIEKQFAVAADPAGEFFAANFQGLFEQQPDPAPWLLHYPPGPPGNDLQSVSVDGNRIYVGTYAQGFGRYDGSSWIYWFPGGCTSACDQKFVDSTYPFGVLVDGQGKKWIGCWGSALEELDDSGPTLQFTHLWDASDLASDKHTWVWSAASDSDGGRWFGMDTPLLGETGYEPIGIDAYDAGGNFVGNYQPSTTGRMNGSQIRALAYEKILRKMWVGFAGGGVESFSLPTSPGGAILLDTLAETTAPNLDVFAIATYGDSIWVFSTSDVRLYTNFGSAKPVIYSIAAAPAGRGAVHPMDVAPDGSVWVGTVNGVRVYRPGGTFEDLTAATTPLVADEVRSIHIDPASGVVWIATNGGLNSYDPHYVAPPPPKLQSLNVRVYPNPALISNAGISLKVEGNGSDYRATVYDLGGRKVRELSGAANGRVFWDGHNASGEMVRPGLYFVRFEAGGRSAVARITLLR
jgi:ligand-binding sensor domain-containing protein